MKFRVCTFYKKYGTIGQIWNVNINLINVKKLYLCEACIHFGLLGFVPMFRCSAGDAGYYKASQTSISFRKSAAYGVIYNLLPSKGEFTVL